MAEDTHVLDQARAVQNGSTDGTIDGQSAGGQEAVPYLGTYRTREAAEQGLAALESHSKAHQSRADKAEALVQQLVGQLSQPKTQGPTAEDQQAQWKEWADTYDKDGDGSMLLQAFADVQAGAVTQATMAAEEKYGKEIAALRETVASISGQVASQNPEYLAVKDDVEALREQFGDLPQATLIKLAKTVQKARGPSQPERAALPGSSGGTAIVGGGSGESWDWAAQEARLGMKIPESQRAAFKAKWSR